MSVGNAPGATAADSAERVTGRPPSPRRRELPTLELLALALVLAVVGRPFLAGFVDQPALQTFSTIFISITVQALPFLVLGVVVSGAIAALVPPGWLARVLPRNPVLAVPAASIAGVALPGCECGSVPIAGRLTAGGAAPPAALAFMLAAPAINPVVIVATAVAFPGQPRVVVARFLASLLTAIAVGLVWSRIGRDAWVERARRRIVEGTTRWESFSHTARHDFLHAGGWLVLGGAMAATLQTLVPRSILDALGGNGVVAVLTLAVLAVVLAICSEADGFVAASLSTVFPTTALLTFMVVGPAVDIKLVALQSGVFGRSFALRFAPLTFVVAVASAVLVATVVL